MIEYIIWATNPITSDRRPISDRVYNKDENDNRVETAKRNGWQDVIVQKIDLNDNGAILKSFTNAIN